MSLARGLSKIAWATALAAGGAAIGHAALKTEDGRELDENLFKALNAEHGETVDRFFAGITELGSLYAAAAAAAAPSRARVPPGCSSRGRSASSIVRGRSSRTRRVPAG